MIAFDVEYKVDLPFSPLTNSSTLRGILSLHVHQVVWGGQSVKIVGCEYSLSPSNGAPVEDFTLGELPRLNSTSFKLSANIRVSWWPAPRAFSPSPRARR